MKEITFYVYSIPISKADSDAAGSSLLTRSQAPISLTRVMEDLLSSSGGIDSMRNELNAKNIGAVSSGN